MKGDKNMNEDVDILVITYNRPYYSRLTLERLLETCDETARVWIWQNGSHAETVSVVASFLEHPRVFRYHHSPENKKLRDPTNWILSEGTGSYVAKVDDDSLVPHDWLTVLRRAHKDEPKFGALGCWHFMPEDFRPEIAGNKIREFTGGHRILCHPWVQGSGIVFKRVCVERVGLIQENVSGVTSLLTSFSMAGWVNGWYVPLLWLEHMDDPRAPHTLIKTDEDLLQHLPLSASHRGSMTVDQWDKQLRASALDLQRSPSDPKYYTAWRRKLRALTAPLKKAIRSK